MLSVKNNMSREALRKDFHIYNTRDCKVDDVSYQRLSKSQNSYEVLGFKMYNKLKLELNLNKLTGICKLDIFVSIVIKYFIA